MDEAIRTFQCEVNGNTGLTVVIKLPNRYVDDVQISIGPIGKLDEHRGVYLSRAAIMNLMRFIQETDAPRPDPAP